MILAPVLLTLSLAEGEEEEERSATWSSLFFDLVFASVIAAMGDSLKDIAMPFHQCVLAIASARAPPPLP